MSTDEKQICLYCKWWKSSFRGDVPPQTVTFGQCRVSAPIASKGWNAAAVWPETKGHDFCGKFENRRDDHPVTPNTWQTIGEASSSVLDATRKLMDGEGQ